MDWLNLVEPVPPIRSDARIEEVFQAFRRDLSRTLFPVVDAEGKPAGVVRDGDLKPYTYAPYGRELIRRKPVSAFAVPSDELPHHLDTEAVLRRAGSASLRDGFVVTREGRYAGFLPKDAVLRLYETQRKATEQQILQLQRVESLGTLAGGIAHELNNVLMPIIGNAELALDEVAEGTRVHRSLTRMIAAAGRASQIVRQILVFSRPDESERSLVRLTEVAAEGLGLLQASLPSTIQIRPSLTARSDTVLADPTQIHQVVLNLCKNAAQAIGRSHGVIDVAVEDVEVDESFREMQPSVPEGSFVRLSVRDTGCGMASDVLGRIFEPFFTTKEVGEGTGLGLAVVLGIARSHQGVVTVESQQGAGSTFSVWFPAVRGSAGQLEAGEAEAPGGSGSILFVDDDESISDLGRELLSGLGYDVTATTSSLRALEFFRADPGRFDLVITDLTMPALTREGLVRELLALRGDVPILVCSGYGDALAHDAPVRDGVREFLNKPVSRSTLAGAVQRALSGARADGGP